MNKTDKNAKNRTLIRISTKKENKIDKILRKQIILQVMKIILNN